MFFHCDKRGVSHYKLNSKKQSSSMDGICSWKEQKAALCLFFLFFFLLATKKFPLHCGLAVGYLVELCKFRSAAVLPLEPTDVLCCFYWLTKGSATLFLNVIFCGLFPTWTCERNIINLDNRPLDVSGCSFVSVSVRWKRGKTCFFFSKRSFRNRLFFAVYETLRLSIFQDHIYRYCLHHTDS